MNFHLWKSLWLETNSDDVGSSICRVLLVAIVDQTNQPSTVVEVNNQGCQVSALGHVLHIEQERSPSFPLRN